MNSLLRLLVTGTLVTVPGVAAAQDAVPVVRSDVRITPKAMTRPVVEPMVAAHPTDPDRLIGIAIRTFHDRRWVPEQDCISFRSDNGGRTWTTAPLPSIQCGDPWVAYGADGAAWGVFVARASADTARSSLFVYRLAPDAGAHEWEQVAILPFGDHPTIAVDTTAGPYHGTVYVAANRVLRNALGRRHFGVVVWRLRPNSNGFQQTGVAHALNLNVNSDNPVILPGGRLVVPFDDFMRDVDDFRGGGRLESKRTWLLISDNGGRDFLEPVLVSESCGSGFDYMDIGRIEPEPHLYHVCLGREGRSVLVHSSRDGGLRWTEPTAIGRGGLDSKGAVGVAANRFGHIAVTWQDRSTGDSECRRAVIAVSSDAGDTFSDPVAVSTRPSCPHNPANRAAGERWSSGSDYGAIAVGADGRFHMVWADARDGAFALYTARAEVR